MRIQILLTAQTTQKTKEKALPMALPSVDLNSLQPLFPRDWSNTLILFLKIPQNRVASFVLQRLGAFASNLGRLSFCLKSIVVKP